MTNNVFISYGHRDYDFIAQRLAQDLRACNFDVFLDTDYLNAGADWEEKIDEHILASKFFLFLSSSRSTSPSGYCLNELCRAGENNSVIIPIMLDESKIPLSINKLQRLSLVDAITPQGALNEEKYKEVVLQLTGVLSGSTVLGFSDKDQRLKSCLKPISSGDFAFRYYSSFCGRRSAFEAFEKFLASPKNFFWVKASPGAGKTAFASMLSWKYSNHVSAIHFCRFNNSDRANPKYIITSIAYQLAHAIPEYKEKLYGLVGLENIFEKNPTRIFEYLLVEPTADIRLTQPTVIIIDALDESSFHGDNEICALLQRMRDRIPSWMKFVLTSRDESNIRTYLSTIATTYELSDAENKQDLREYYRSEFPEASDEKIEALLAKSEGSFLYATEIVKQIREDNLSLDDISFFPVGIYGFFYDWLSRLFGPNSNSNIPFNSIKPVFEFLCISKEPVNVDFLGEYLEIDEYELMPMLAIISGLFPIRNHYIEPLHKSLIDWLTISEDIPHMFYISTKSAYLRLLSYIERKYAQGELSNPYLVKYFGSTLIKLEKYDRLIETLTDYELQASIIKYSDFDSGLVNYINNLKVLYKVKRDECIKLLGGNAFITIFSTHRRLLYNSGMFLDLKEIGLSVALRTDTSNWGVEGEIGKAFYYYIVEDFPKAINKCKQLLEGNEDVKNDTTLQSELYNVKGLSERKLVRFDSALESFQNCIDILADSIDGDRDNSDAEFELSLAYLIISKINMHMLDFDACNMHSRKSIKILNRKIDEMPDGDKRISNELFLAEEYRVWANAYIWQREFDLAEMNLKNCEDIYRKYNNSTDRYFIRFRYTSLLLKIMDKQFDGVVAQLEALKNGAKSNYDKATINYYIALCVYMSKESDAQMLSLGQQCAQRAVDIFDDIDSYLERAEANLINKKLCELVGKRFMNVSDENDNHYVKAWVEYIDKFIEEVKG
ncbi:MAG: toll/interleukin-1 receptor domain-containing protein [Clostridia bacterium]|nr:toll/interleukin-1 receptor domain-containing protein [Clostridia bacterium]